MFTELDDHKLFSRGMTSIILRAQLHIFLELFYFFKSIIKNISDSLSPK